MSISSRAQTLNLRGDALNLVADAWGEPAAPAVIFLHGGGQSRSAWGATARVMAEAGYYAVSLDLRGHGASDWAPDGDYSFAAYVRDLAAVIAQVGGQAALVGASLGGRASLLMATTHPEMVAAIVLADVTPRMDEDVADEIRTFFHASAEGFDSLEAAAATLSSLAAHGRPPQPERLRGNMREANGRFFWRWDPRFVEERFVRDPTQLALLERSAADLKTPALMIRAGESIVVRQEHVDHFLSIAPHVETHVAPGIGHMLTGDANDAYAPLALDFLRRTYPSL